MIVFWMVAQPWDNAGGQSVSVYACSADLSKIVSWNGAEYLPVMDGGPTIDTNVFDGAFTGQVSTTRGQVALLANGGDIDAWAGYSWTSRPVQIWEADIDVSRPNAPGFPNQRKLVFDGLGDTYDPDEANLALTVHLPDGTIADTNYLGDGTESDAGLFNTLKPFAAGVHKNRSTVLRLAGKLCFQVHGYGPIGSLDVVREGGRPLDQAIVNHDTDAQLLAATVPATEIHYCPASGSFRLGFTPNGTITADFHGDAFAGTRVGDIVQRLLTKSGWNPLLIDTDSLTELDAAYPFDIQYYDASGADISDALTALLMPMGAYWDVDQLGVFYVGQVVEAVNADLDISDDGTASYDVLDVDHLATKGAFWKIRMGWGENPNVMDFSDTEAGATADQIAQLEGALTAPENVFAQTNAPASPPAQDGDYWIDDNQNWYRYTVTSLTSASWDLTTDTGIPKAILAAAGAQAIADGKITTFYQENQPTGQAEGDLWFQPSTKKLTRWDGSNWSGYLARRIDDANDVTYVGGQTVESLQPQEAGANITEDRTAAAITGQGYGATAPEREVSNAYITINADGSISGAGGGQVSFKGLGGGALGLLASLFFGSNLFTETDGGDIATLNAFKTLLGTSAGFYGQGDLSTRNTVGSDHIDQSSATDMLILSNTNTYQGSGPPGTGSASGGSGGGVSTGGTGGSGGGGRQTGGLLP